MALSKNRELQNGSDIMMFIKDNGTYKSIAHASSHTLSLSADTESINTKDNGIWGKTTVNKINWEITCDHFYTADGYETFFEAMMAGATSDTRVTVGFGLKADEERTADATVNVDDDGNWTTTYNTTPSVPYWGEAIITSLEWNADAGSKSTFSATLQGAGPITYMTSAS